MKEIGKIVQDAWDFFIPPLIKITLIFVLTIYVSNSSVLVPISFWMTSAINSFDESIFIKFISTYELQSLVPFATLFFIALILYATNKLIFMVSRLIPLDIVLIGLGRYQKGELLDFWRFYPEIKNVGNVIRMLEHLTATSAKPDGSNNNYWSNQISKFHVRMDLTKFLMIWTVLLYFFSPYMSIEIVLNSSRIWIVLIVLIAFFLYYILKNVSAFEQEAYERIFRAQLISNEKGRKRISTEAPQVDKMKKEIASLGNEKWWSLTLSVYSVFQLSHSIKSFQIPNFTLTKKFFQEILDKLKRKTVPKHSPTSSVPEPLGSSQQNFEPKQAKSLEELLAEIKEFEDKGSVG